MTFYTRNIETLDIEPSSFCNARCPQCLRESKDGDYSFFNQTNLTDTFFEVYFPKDVASKLKRISFSGNIGEPAMNKHLLNILRWFKNHNPNVKFEIYTNGSVQKPDWWRELGEVIGDNSKVIFAIDGLEDTNSIYRIGVKWDQLIANVKEYIKTGSTAVWQFIPFEHNEHQILAAEHLSQELNFKEFKLKISHRDLLNQTQNQKNKVYPAKNPLYRHEGQKLDFINLDRTEQYLNNLKIDCFAISNSNLYISADGLVFPCCHTASIPLLDEKFIPEPYHWIKNVKDNFDFEEISLYKNTLDQIINSKTFRKIKDSWGTTMNQGKNPICAAICGKCDNSNSLKDFL